MTEVVVLWLERAIDGTAASSHLRGTLARLASLDVNVTKVIADRSSQDGRERISRKVGRLLKLIMGGVLAARRGRLLLARYHPALLPVVAVWRVLGGRVVLSVQGAVDSVGNENPWLKGSRLFRLLATAPAKMADGLIVGAPVIESHVRAEMLGKNRPLAAIPNGVFLKELVAASESPRPMDREYAVFVGNLAGWQGIDTLVAALEEPDWPHDLPLVVVGDGAERELVLNHPNLLWKGRLPSREARTWLAHAVCAFSVQRADVEVARHGYWPFKLIESAAAGVPMICSDAPGLPEAATRLGHAVVVPAHDSRATAVATAGLWGSKSRRETMSAKGKVNAKEYDWESGAPALGNFIDLVLARQSR